MHLPTNTLQAAAVEIVDAGGLHELALSVAARQASPQTRRTYAGVYAALEAFLGPTARPEDLTAHQVARYRDHLEARKLAPATIAKHLSAVRVLLREIGLPDAHRALEIRSESVARGKPRPITEQQARLLLSMPDLRTTRGIRDRAILLVMIDAGLRRGEVHHLNLASIEERRRHAGGARAAIGETTTWALRVSRGKGRTERLLPLTHDAVDALRFWIQRRPTCRTDALFVSIPNNTTGHPERIALRTLSAMVANYAERAELPSTIAPHVLRHTFATRAAESNAPIDVIQHLLGHADIRTTQIYARRREDAADQVIDELDRQRTAAFHLGSGGLD